MADRSVKVTVGANVQPLKAAMADGSRSVEGLTGATTTLGTKLKTGLAMAGVTGGIFSLGAAIKSTFTLGMDFTTQLNTLQAVTGATGDEMVKVAAKARALGNDVSLPATSARDAAEAMTELAKGGLSVQQAMAAAKGTLQLAAAAQVSGAQAAQIQANALNTFGLSASDAGHVADVLANTANAASGEITDFAQGMQQAGSVAKLFGISLDDTSTVLGLFANNGIKGSDAGTSLKTMLTQLATPSKNAQTAMSELGLTVYDASGQFVGMRSLTEQLATAQGHMSQQAFQSAAGILFGSDAIRGASILASGGAAAYDKMSVAVGKAGGAAELANAQMKGLPGALQQAENAIQDVALGLYEKLAPAVESVIHGFSQAVEVAGPIVVATFGAIFSVLGTGVSILGKVASAVGALPGPVKAFGLALAGLAIANKIGLLGGLSRAFSGVGSALGGLRGMWSRLGDDAAMSGVSRMRVGLGLVGGAAKSAGSSVLSAFGGPWGLAIAGAAAGISLLISQWQAAQPKVTDFTTAIDENTGALAANAQAAIAKSLSESGAFDVIKKVGIDTETYTLALLGNADAQRQVNAALAVQPQGNGGEQAKQRYDLALATKQYAADLQNLAGKQTAANDVLHASGKPTADQAAAVKAATLTLAGYVDASDEAKAVALATAGAFGLIGVAASGSARAQDESKASALAWSRAAAAVPDTVGNMTTKITEFGDQTQLADTRLKFFTISVDALAGRDVSLEEATKLLNDQVRAIKEAFTDATKATKGHVESLISADGQINTTTEAGSKLYDSVSSYRQAYDTATTAAVKSALATGTTTDALKAAQAAADGARQKFLDQAAAMGISHTEAVKMADAMGILEGKKLTPKTLGLLVNDEATPVVANLQKMTIADKRFRVTAEVSQVTGEKIFITGAGGRGMARGGWIPGAAGGEWITGGTPGQDSVPRWLMPGEAVIPTASAQANRPIVDALIQGRPVAGAAGPQPVRVSVDVNLRGDGVITGAMAREAGVQIRDAAEQAMWARRSGVEVLV